MHPLNRGNATVAIRRLPTKPKPKPKYHNTVTKLTLADCNSIMVHTAAGKPAKWLMRKFHCSPATISRVRSGIHPAQQRASLQHGGDGGAGLAFCHQCGQPAGPNWIFCGHCGKSLAPTAHRRTNVPRKRKG